MYIISTVGPSINNEQTFNSIINKKRTEILRINFSHIVYKDTDNLIKLLKDSQSDIKLLYDLPGFKVRVSKCIEYSFKVYEGEMVEFCSENEYKNMKNRKTFIKIIPLNISEELLKTIKKGYIYIKDKTMKFIIKKNNGGVITALTDTGGIIRAGKGCNIKNLNIIDRTLDSKNIEALNYSIRNRADIICQSFVESKEDINLIRNFINDNKQDEKYSPKIWAKIESRKGIENLDEIVNVSDGVMIARGDLAAEITFEEIPFLEEKIIKKTRMQNKDIVIATHVLDSMKYKKEASIPEIESIYRFIKLGVSGFLLASETSVGKFPLKTIEYLRYLINIYK
ncbi:pyruvate kinase [Clostridium sp. BJN0001]|uniref:pyruvate kinase n=1 Tax=Clostridium sp. BJN0001 TaxID=2930219 RepID=UPI001FD1908B|nr:pyruvate kinase [Clostridium sp. BJN0001]